MKAVNSNLRLAIFIAGAILLAVGLVWAGLRYGRGEVPPAVDIPPAAPVKWIEARQFFVEEWTEAIGTTQPLPDRVARITAPTEGHVVSVLQAADGKTMVEGQIVKKGDVIVQLDIRHSKAQRDKAEATFEELKQLTEQVKIAARLHDMDFQRLVDLSNTSKPGSGPLTLVSPIEMEKARLSQQDSAAKLKAAEYRQLAAALELQALDEHLHQHTLTAPIDGRLGRLLVVLGQTLPAGTLVADVVNIDEKIDVLCFVPPHVAKRLKKGQPARIGGIDEKQSGVNPEGAVEFIADQAEVDTGNFAVKVRFPNHELGQRVNTTLRMRMLTTPGKACLTLPESAVFMDQDPPTVVVVEEHKLEKNAEGKEIETGKARKLQVTLGIRDRALHLVEVLSLRDPENKWTGTLDTAKFVIERGQGLRTDDPIRLEVED